MRVYSWIGGDRPSDVAKDALEKKGFGFSAIKMNATEELQIVDQLREDRRRARARSPPSVEAAGKDFGIAIDFHGRVHKPMAKVLAKKLEPFDIMFIEEPVLCDNMESFRDVARACKHPRSPPASGSSRAGTSSGCSRAAMWTLCSQISRTRAASPR